jgi:hypothetical protein
MKSIKIILMLVALIPLTACNARTDNNEKSLTDASGDKIVAYYFHLTTRCVTCKTIESEARQDLEMLYPEETNEGIITFRAINIEEESGKALAEKLGVSGQALLFVKGEQKINLTNEGFMYAVAKPEKFREIIKEKIDELLTD